MTHEYSAGEQVVYQATKQSQRPGPRARNIDALTHGDYYSYTVDKYWIVAQTHGQDGLIVRTRRGKRRTIPTDDPKLRPATWWERIIYSKRFPSPEE